MKLSLKKTSQGYYTNTDGKRTITVSDARAVIGGKSEWQIVIIDGDEVTLNEFCATKRECYEIGVAFLINDLV